MIADTGTRAPESAIHRRSDGEQVVATQGHRLPPGPKGSTYKPIKAQIDKG